MKILHKLLFCLVFLGVLSVIGTRNSWAANGVNWGSTCNTSAGCSSPNPPNNATCYPTLCPGACGTYSAARYAGTGNPFITCTNVAPSCGGLVGRVSQCNWYDGCCTMCSGCSICAPDDNNWGACSVSCGGGVQYNSCGRSQSCNTQPCCTDSNPDAPTLTLPANNQQIFINTSATFSWNAIANWGTNCGGNNNRYEINIPGTPSISWANNGTNTSYIWTPTAGNSSVTWSVRSNNGARTSTSSRTVCVEGGAVISAWGACDANTHMRTRTCSENCGVDDCAAVTLSENCTANVAGTLFDASDLSSCPAFSPTTGYLTGLLPEYAISNQTFGFADQTVAGGTHPWLPITSPLSTNASGNYTFSVYAPTTYVYDFTNLGTKYLVGSGPKLTCNTTSATVPTSPIACTTQPCSSVLNMSFGFNRIYDGWWQTAGASVYGDLGVKSVIPSSLATEMSLILPSSGRSGLLSYGVLTTNMLGTNPNAQANSNNWHIESKYAGPVYDYNFFDQRFNLYTKNTWDGTSSIVYDDSGLGYEILKVQNSITNFTYNPAAGEKLMIEVAGDVTVTTDIVVPNGAFLAIIASGNITFTSNVIQADGWYVGNKITVECKDIDGTPGCDKTDTQFQGNGTFVGWAGIDLYRDRYMQNNSGPSELFTYRRDLYNNAPDPMKIFSRQYKPFVP